MTKRQIRNCVQCGVELGPKVKKYCSASCRKSFLKQLRLREWAEYSPSVGEDVKACKNCGKEKPLSEFRSRKNRKPGNLNTMCRECERDAAREARLNKKWQGLDKQKSYERERKWRLEHTEEWSEYQRKYRNKPERLEPNRQHVRDRDARIRGVDATLTIDEWVTILETFNYQCVYCGAPYEHQDHFIPLSKGGTHTADNVVPACGPCNQRKSNKDPLEFIGCGGGKP